MIRINVEITVSQPKRAAVLDNILRLAEKSRQENGCIGYEIYENSTKPQSLLILETWESREALDAHEKTEHFRTLVPITHENAESMEIKKFSF